MRLLNRLKNLIHNPASTNGFGCNRQWGLWWECRCSPTWANHRDTNQAMPNIRANYLYNNRQAERGYQNNAALADVGLRHRIINNSRISLEQDQGSQAQNLMQQFSQNSQCFPECWDGNKSKCYACRAWKLGFNRGDTSSISMMPEFSSCSTTLSEYVSSLVIRFYSEQSTGSRQCPDDVGST